MKEIKLSEPCPFNPNSKNVGKYVALVDDEDYENLIKYRWTARVEKYTVYATRMNPNGVPKTIKMHRQIMGVQIASVLIDHKDRNGLNNQKTNLRECSQAQNLCNRPKLGGSSKYAGVSWDKRREKWYTRVKHKKQTYFLGHFVNEEDAARAYDGKAKELHGEFAYLNFP